VWSNDAVAHDDPNEASPRNRDDWVPESAVPDPDVFGRSAQRSGGPAGAASSGGVGGEPPPEDFDDDGALGSSSRSTVGRKVVAGGVVLALLIGSAGALLRNDDSSEDPTPPTTPSTTPSTTSVGDRTPTTLEAVRSGFVYPDSWAADSSGLFIAGQPLQFVGRATGGLTAIDSLDAIRTVATGPFTRQGSIEPQ